jgi:uncharacterized protein (TIGR03083 family)
VIGFDRLQRELTAQTAAFAAAVARLELLDPPPTLRTCPDWSVRDIVEHVGRAHRWAAEIIERRIDHPFPLPQVTAPDGPPAARTQWLTEGAARLNLAATDLGPEGAVWTWSADRTARFWVGRIMHDTLIHRVDAELGLAAEPAVEADLAADGVRDLLHTIATLSSQPTLGLFQGLRGQGQTLHFHATDTDGEWFVIREPDRVTWRTGHEKADVAVRGPARDLLLVLNRRLDPGQAAVDSVGAEALFTHWLANSAF